MKEGDIELLAEIAKFEDSQNMEELRMGWSWRHVRICPATLSRLFLRGYQENVFRSNSYTGYRLKMLSPELKSRFAIQMLSAYSRNDYLTVVKGVLSSRENLSPEVAGKIALLLDVRTQDVRDAIRVARLVPQLGVTRAINLLMEGGL